MIRFSQLPLVLVALAMFSSAAITSVPTVAEARERNPRRIDRNLKKVCPSIVDINESTTFYKNNKPLRSSSKFDAPVIGYFRQMTLANNKGVRSAIGSETVTMYDSKGGVLTRMTPYSCRPDHCGGRVVSVGQTDVTRRLAIKRTKSPAGFIQVSKTRCIKIADIGRCYGVAVNKTRALCDRVVG